MILDEHIAAHVAELFRAFGDTTRVRILSAILDQELNVSSLAEKVGVSESSKVAQIFLSACTRSSLQLHHIAIKTRKFDSLPDGSPFFICTNIKKRKNGEIYLDYNLTGKEVIKKVAKFLGIYQIRSRSFQPAGGCGSPKPGESEVTWTAPASGLQTRRRGAPRQLAAIIAWMDLASTALCGERRAIGLVSDVLTH